MGRYKQREAFHFGIDYFKAYIKADTFKKSLLFGLAPGSNYKMYDKETMIQLIPELSGKKYSKYFEIIDKSTNVRLAFILLGKVNGIGAIERRDKIEVSGQGLILRNIPYYLKMLDVLGYYIDGFQRVDIALDIKINTDYLIRNVIEPNVDMKTCKPHTVNGLRTGIEIGRKENKLNTWKFIRIYNKILDTDIKGKDFLYNFKEKGIKDLSRIELELRRDKCKFFKLDYLTDPDKLFEIFQHEVFKINYQFFKFVHKEDVRKVIETYLINMFENVEGMNLTKGMKSKKYIALKKHEQIINFGSIFKSDNDRRRTMSIFVSSFKKLLGNGHTMVDILDIIDINSWNYEYTVIEEILRKTKKRLKECFITS